MAQQELRVEERIAAPPVRVWELLGDSTTWPTWTPIEAVDVLAPGEAGGLGEVRVMRRGRFRIRERIVEKEPPRRYAYTVEGGLGVRDYRAVVDLEGDPDGTTRLRWQTTFRPKVPGFGGVYRRALERATHEFVSGLAGASARRASTTSASDAGLSSR